MESTAAFFSWQQFLPSLSANFNGLLKLLPVKEFKELSKVTVDTKSVLLPSTKPAETNEGSLSIINCH